MVRIQGKTSCHPKLGSTYRGSTKLLKNKSDLNKCRIDLFQSKIIQGKLKRELGDKRLRLPPWLKGKNNTHLFAII